MAHDRCNRPLVSRDGLLTAALCAVAVLGLVWTLREAASVFLPLAMAIFLNVVLDPVMQQLTRIGLPKVLAASLLLVLILSSIVLGLANLAEPAREWLQQAPRSMAALEDKTRQLRWRFKEVADATEQVREMARELTPDADGDKKQKATEVVVSKESADSGFVSAATSTVLTLILLFFLLVSESPPYTALFWIFRDFGARRRIARMANTLQTEMSRLLLRMTLINVSLGLAVAIAMQLLDMPNPWLWGVLACMLNYIPYAGPVITVGIISVVSLLSYDTFQAALYPPLVFAVLTFVEGYFISPTVHARQLSLSPLLVLLSVLVWYWIWGIAGMLLAVPILLATQLLLSQLTTEFPNLRSRRTADTGGHGEPATAS